MTEQEKDIAQATALVAIAKSLLRLVEQDDEEEHDSEVNGCLQHHCIFYYIID